MKYTLPHILHVLFGALVLLAPLSFYPSLATPVYNFPSFRIGLYQVLVCVFVLLMLPEIYRFLIRPNWGPKDRLVIGVVGLLSSIALYGATGAEYFERSLLLAGSFILLVIFTFAVFVYVKTSALVRGDEEWSRIFRYMTVACLVYGGISVLQLVVGTLTSTDNALLCKGCGSDVFGFPRISGLAAEPLFWANALLPFFVVALIHQSRTKTRLSALALVSVSVAIALTFARGAYFACAGVLAIWVIFQWKNKRDLVRPIALVALSCALGFMMLITSATVRYKEAPYITYNTARGMLEHLTLGVISLPVRGEAVIVSPTIDESDFVSEGLVEASSNDRLESARTAIDIWFRSENILLGVGLGNLGPYAVRYVDPALPDNLTVYIFYVLFLSEMGILGFMLVATLFVMALRSGYRKRETVLGAVVFLSIVGFLMQYFFLGSYINVAYIWLWLGVGLALGGEVATTNEKRRRLGNRKPVSK